MPQYQQELFLLMANLIQYRNKDEVLRIFREALADMLAEVDLEFHESLAHNHYFHHIFEIKTANSSHGYITITENLEHDTVEHLQNATQMLGVILENIDQQKLLGDEKALLENTVREKTKELQQAEYKYRQMFEQSADGIMITNAETGEVIDVNPMMCTLLGREYKDIIGRHHTEFHTPEYQEAAREAIASYHHQSPEDTSRGPEEAIFVRPDGSRRTTEVRTQLINRGEQEVLAAFFRDITQRKENEEKVQKSERRLSTLMANLPGMAYQCYNDKNWTMLFLNQGCLTLTGYKPETIQNDSKISYGDLILPEDRSYVWKSVQKSVKERTPFTVTYRIRTKSGQLKWVWERGRYVMTDTEGREILEGFISDITQQKQAEYELKQNLARFKALINNMQSGVLVEDYSRKIISANQKLCDLFGAPEPEALLGQDCGFAAEQISGLFIDPEQFLSRIDEILNNREIVINEELNLKDGRTFERDYVPVFIEDTFSGNMWIYRDITHQKQHEQAIKNSLEEKKTLLKEIHHRVKNNLSVITSLLRLQSATLPEEDHAQKALEETYNQIHSMAQVHEQLYQSEDFSSIDMYLYIESLISRLSQSYPSSANIDFQLKADHVRLDINKAIPCGLILNELITNSIKHAFTDSNTGTVSIEMTKNNTGTLLIRVKDNGKGLPESFNLEEVETLGLELVNMLTRQLDASLEINNSDGVAVEMNVPLGSTGI